MKKIICLLIGLFIGLFIGSVNATIVTETDFSTPTIIDFETAPSGLIDGYYSSLGVTFVNLDGGNTYDTGSGSSLTATNFYTTPGFPNGEALFDSLITQVGFDIITNAGDDTTLFAYSGSSLIGSHTFTTDLNGSFVGIEFITGFDRLVIDTFGQVNGAFAVDNFRFDGDVSSVPEPTSLALLGLGLAGIGFSRKKKPS